MIKKIFSNQNKNGYYSFERAILPLQYPINNWKIIGKGLDTNNRVFERNNLILKITFIESFYSSMYVNALNDIHATLHPLNIAPKLQWMKYREPYLITIFDKLETVGYPTAFEIGETLAKAHIALQEIPVKKSYPWIGFYGTPDEFKIIIPQITHQEIRKKSEILLSKAEKYQIVETHQYIHRDLNPTNIIKTNNGLNIIDWDMAHGGYCIDDLAMSICCLAPYKNNESLLDFYFEFINGYRQYKNKEWICTYEKNIIPAIAIAGLRQAVGGWFTDKGDLSNSYWPNIMNRLNTSIKLCKLL